MRRNAATANPKETVIAAVPSIGRADASAPPLTAEAIATRDLYERFSPQLYSFCVHQLGSREEAEDAVQSTFLNAHRALQRGVTPEAESAWLFKIAHNVCLTRRRSARRRVRVESPSDLQSLQDVLSAPQRDGGDDLIRLTDALAHMPDNQRRAILLREWQGLSYHEIAQELDLSQSAVETLIFRARRSLADKLQPPAEENQASLVSRARAALDIGSLLAVAKGLLSGGAAVKTAAAAMAVTGATVVAASPPADRSSKQSDAPLATKSAPAEDVVSATLQSIASVEAARSATSVRAMPQSERARSTRPAKRAKGSTAVVAGGGHTPTRNGPPAQTPSGSTPATPAEPNPHDGQPATPAKPERGKSDERVNAPPSAGPPRDAGKPDSPPGQSGEHRNAPPQAGPPEQPPGQENKAAPPEQRNDPPGGGPPANPGPPSDNPGNGNAGGKNK